MNDASKADIRIIDVYTKGNVIHCGPEVEVPSYKEEIKILTDDKRFLVSDVQLEGLKTKYTVATDF